MPEEVLSWIKDGRDYNAGLEILRRHTGNTWLVKLLASGPDAFNTPKLFKELQKLPATFGPPTDDVIPSALPAAAGSAAPDPGYVPNHNLEKQLRIKQMIKVLLQEMAHLHGKVVTLPEGNELFEAAKDLLLKDLKKQDLWNQLHYFERHGKWFDELPENQPNVFNPANQVELEQKIKNLMASRAKARKILKKPQPESMVKHQQKRIEDFTSEIEKLQKLKTK